MEPELAELRASLRVLVATPERGVVDVASSVVAEDDVVFVCEAAS
jgi:hypothetical protein